MNAGDLSRGKRSRVGVVLITVARYLLAFGMLPYGISKLEGMQFQVPAWNYALPLWQASGKTLLWATMGYSPRLQMLLGLFEVVPSILLLIQRTRRIGALLMLPVAANVWLLNMGLDLWTETKITSGVLLLLSILLVLYDLRIYRRFFAELLLPPEPVDHPRLRVAAQVATVGVPLLAAMLFYIGLERPIHAMQANWQPFIGERQINRAGTWKIARLVVDGTPVTLPPGQTHLYFDFGNRVVLGTPDHPLMGQYHADAARHTIQIDKLQLADSSSPISGSYHDTPTSLEISGTRDGKPVLIALERDGWGSMR